MVTADDDFYVPNWLEELVAGYDPAAPTIVCHRAHPVLQFGSANTPLYLERESDVQDEAARRPSTDLLAVGLGGTLYPSRSLHPDATDHDAFTRLCPHADDLWCSWCARRAGSLYKKIGGPFPILNWDSTQKERLFNLNATESDAQLRRLLDAYGDPNAPEGAGAPPYS
ncbi:hypothetical protein [Sphingomonas lenta]|uniref:Glycosyltransferase 2-like domain-containing protein n=1 Tax=Sphingomonas lenta TaxID=1141887 RepID=A0A2A2SAU9_9SPHN|nr:hypothetical protein [Sphingomonas lenta]PAX06343.1 hypothetical protein CKY28_17850 [Sphingomonas lenta]